MKKSLIIVLPVLAACVACAKVDVQQEEERPVTFNVVNYLQQTRANTAYSTENTFGTYAYFTPTDWKTDGTGTPFYENEEVKYGPDYAPGEWGTEGRFFWPKVAKLTFASYSPYVNSSTASSMGFSDVPTFSQVRGFVFSRYAVVPDADVDLMVADLVIDQTANRNEYALSSNTEGVPTLFRHVMTQVALTFKCGENFNPGVDGSEIVIKRVRLTGIREVGDFSQNGLPMWTRQSGSAEYEFNPDSEGSHIIMSDPSKVYQPAVSSFILLPQELTEGGQRLELVYSIRTSYDGSWTEESDMTATVDLVTDAIPTWSPNMSIVYNITIDPISKDPILFDPAIADWNVSEISLEL